jgi:hypothetical protein
MATVPDVSTMALPAVVAALKTAGLRGLNLIAYNAGGGAVECGISSAILATGSRPVAGSVIPDNEFVIINWGRGVS